MEKTTTIQQAIGEIYEKLEGKYYSEKENPLKNSKKAEPDTVCLSNLIFAILAYENVEFETAVKDITDIIKAYPCGEEILENEIFMDGIIEDTKIRRSFEKAFEEVENGDELSCALGYGLSKKDLTTLATLHKADKYRRKIEELLEDCNFHEENEKFINGEYDEYVA